MGGSISTILILYSTARVTARHGATSTANEANYWMARSLKSSEWAEDGIVGKIASPVRCANPFDQLILHPNSFTPPSSTYTVDTLALLNSNPCPRQCLAAFDVSQSLIILGTSREEPLQDIPDVEIESNWDQVVDK